MVGGRSGVWRLAQRPSLPSLHSRAPTLRLATPQSPAAPLSSRRQHTLLQRGPIVAHKKCRFQAHVLAVETEEDIAPALAEVLTDKKVSKATHPHIAAWRLGDGGFDRRDDGGFDDCGEGGAGKRLLQLLTARGDTSTLVAVSRWYGGRHLGAARFRQITGVAKDLLQQARGS